MRKDCEFLKVSFDQYGQYGSKENYDDIIMPKRASVNSAGYDFYLPENIEIQPHQAIRIATGIRVRMQADQVLLLVIRSSLGFKYQLALSNTIGVIDSDYFNAENEGHILVSLLNHSEKVVTLDKGKAFVQGIFVSYDITKDDQVETIRTGGIGSSDLRL
ncbi:MAG: deoxyuridine 5'-triphosphate nucleotidohydrolase [Erysipelotrichaceae bacterium]|nr:deoxyuridine 5'-triphosphate nucleotidohydrolase [Erysipelotrichaceae bacterium]